MVLAVNGLLEGFFAPLYVYVMLMLLRSSNALHCIHLNYCLIRKGGSTFIFYSQFGALIGVSNVKSNCFEDVEKEKKSQRNLYVDIHGADILCLIYNICIHHREILTASPIYYQSTSILSTQLLTHCLKSQKYPRIPKGPVRPMTMWTLDSQPFLRLALHLLCQVSVR